MPALGAVRSQLITAEPNPGVQICVEVRNRDALRLFRWRVEANPHLRERGWASHVSNPSGTEAVGRCLPPLGVTADGSVAGSPLDLERRRLGGDCTPIVTALAEGGETH